jgi:polyisoprenoid-binding protein YceI
MITRHERSGPGITTTDRSPPLPTGTWTIDPADSIVSVVWRTFRLWTMTGRLHGLGGHAPR